VVRKILACAVAYEAGMSAHPSLQLGARGTVSNEEKSGRRAFVRNDLERVREIADVLFRGNAAHIGDKNLVGANSEG
jgi:hypothetical protein